MEKRAAIPQEKACWHGTAQCRLEDLRWLVPAVLLNAAGSSSCRARERRPPEPWSKGPSSVRQCHPGLSPRVTEGKRGIFTVPRSRVVERDRTGRRGTDRHHVSTAGKSWTSVSLSHQNLESAVQTRGRSSLDKLQERSPSIFLLALPGRGPCLHSPRWQPEPRPPAAIGL